MADDDAQMPTNDEEASQDVADITAPSSDELAVESAGAPTDEAAVDADAPELEVVDEAGPAEADADAGEAEPAVEAPSSASGASSGGFDPTLLAVVGDDQGVLVPLAVGARDIVQVGLETVAGQPATVSGVNVALTEYDALNGEFGAVDHLGFELKVAISETEAQLAAVLIPIDEVGGLLGLDTSAEAMADEAFSTAQLETVGQRVRELLDLVSLTLFEDGLAGAEVTLSEVRRGQIEWTTGMVQDVAQGAPPVRLDFTATLQEGASAGITLVLPVSLLSRFAGLLSVEEEAEPVAAATPEPVAAASMGGAPGNVSAFPGADVEPPEDEPVASLFSVDSAAAVHPLRFPPLPQPSSSDGSPQPIDLIMDVSMRVTVELGRSTMTVEEILELGPGSVVELNKLAGEPVDILVNERLIARGEVVVVDENFGVRVTEIISPRQRASAMGR